MGNIWFGIHRFLDRLSVPGNGNRWRRYGLVILLIIAFFLIKSILVTALGKDVPFLFSLFIVIISAWFGGFGPGILATVLAGGITYYYYLEPKYTIFGIENIPNAIVIVGFFLEGLFISVMSESHRRSDIQKSEFVGVVSHEIKNPLTSIKGYSELIKKRAWKMGDNKLSEYASKVERQINNVTEMINEMLDITKIETGRLTYHDETFNITDLVKEIVEDRQVTTDTHKIHFKNGGDKFITGDRYRIGQAVTNLISNAIKYSPKGDKVKVVIQNKKKELVISVQDFGPGIAKDDRVKIFEPFYRAKKTLSAKGTGIGLFISRQIIARHKGKIWVKSTIGKGSTFFLSLPFEDK